MTSLTDLASQPAAPAPRSDRGPAISFEEVSKHFPAADGSLLEVLRAVTFDVPCGDIVAILGPSGSGKSTLLNMAAGLIFPDGGRVVVMGERTDAAVDWGKVGYMFQDDRLLPWRRAIDNVALALEAGSMPAAERSRRAGAALDLVELGQFGQAYPHQLSGGMRSRVALARSLVGEPEILLMDEPFSRLDAQTRGSMHRELIRIHAARRMSILFVTHDVEEAVVLADRIVLLTARPGRLRETLEIPIAQPRIGAGEAVALIGRLRSMLEQTPSEEVIR